MSVRGIVERNNWDPGLNWTKQSSEVAIIGGPVVEAIYLTDWPPPPRSIVWVEEVNPGSWVCLGTEGGVRNVFHDDFMGANSSTLGDTTWTRSGATGSLGVGPGGGLGTVRMTTSTVGTHSWGKGSTFNFDVDQPVLLTARIRAANAPNGTSYVGFSDVDPGLGVPPTDAFYVVSNATTTWLLAAWQASAGPTYYDTAQPVSTTSYSVVELLVKSGTIAAAWIDGAGPIVSTVVFDNTTSVPTIWIGTQEAGGIAAILHVDFVRLDLPGSLVAPAEMVGYSVDSDAGVDFTDGDDSDFGAFTASTNDQDIDTQQDPNDLVVGDHYT